MAWQERLREAAYNSPSGRRLTFIYEDVAREVEKKTAAFDFPGVNGTYIQDNGTTSRRYPLRVIFSGPNCDLEAGNFEIALNERGQGLLEHPAYGDVTVVPFGSIKRIDNVKSAGNEVAIELTFWETIGVIYPTEQGDPAAAVYAAIEEYNVQSAEEFGGKLDIKKPAKKVSFRDRYRAAIARVKAGLQRIANAQANVARRFNAISDSIDRGIDVLIDDPLTLAFQTSQLIQAPSVAAAAIGDRLAAYRNLSRSIFGGSSATVNDFYNDDLFASGNLTGSISSTLNNTFTTKADALAAADELLSQFDELTVWRDEQFGTFGAIDTGASFAALQQAVAVAAGFLVAISFDLRQERRFTLDRARNVVELVAELYGTTDDATLDFFIASNALTGDEILEIPQGREIVYYI